MFALPGTQGCAGRTVFHHSVEALRRGHGASLYAGLLDVVGQAHGPMGIT